MKEFGHEHCQVTGKLRSVVLAAGLCLISACAFNPQTVKIAPVVSFPSSELGKGKEVFLTVVDERPKQILGHRGTAYGAAAEITSNDDMATVIREKMSAGLSSNGFRVKTGSSLVSTSMKVEIRLIEYTTSTGFWTGGVHTRAAFKGVCKNGFREYGNLYRQENEERVLVVPDAETNEQWINRAVGQALDKIFNDQEMLACLSG
jgi:Uncharacterized lipoprotein